MRCSKYSLVQNGARCRRLPGSRQPCVAALGAHTNEADPFPDSSSDLCPLGQGRFEPLFALIWQGECDMMFPTELTKLRIHAVRDMLFVSTLIANGLLLAGMAHGDNDKPLIEQAAPAGRLGSLRLDAGIPNSAQQFQLTCYQDPLNLIVNPGCFRPPAAGDCRTQATHYFVQYITPNFEYPHRIAAISFISNDASTIFPSAGVVLIPASENRFPTPGELANLQAINLQASADLAAVVADLSQANLEVSSGTDLVVCLQFPEGEQLTAVGVGPGILVDEVQPDQNCDFFTVDAGGSWWRPSANDPLDWGFRVVFEEPTVGAKAVSWSAIKTLFGGERLFPYRTP